MPFHINILINLRQNLSTVAYAQHQFGFLLAKEMPMGPKIKQNLRYFSKLENQCYGDTIVMLFFYALFLCSMAMGQFQELCSAEFAKRAK